MKNWVKHFVSSRLDFMAAHSFRNCHAFGVDSIMFDDTRGREIRLFIAHENHTLASNLTFAEARGDMTVAYHPHHCDIELHVVCNCITNINAFVREYTVENSPAFKQYEYRSKIRDGESRFRLLDPHVQLHTMTDVTTLYEGQTLRLSASQLHTIAVAQGGTTAWFVYEGEEDPNYQNVVYSNADLSSWTGEGLYLPMSQDEVVAALQAAELL